MNSKKWIIVVVASLLGAMAAGENIKRPAAVYYSDGRVETGLLSLTPGRSFKLTIPEAGSIATFDMITGQEVKYGKVRSFDLRPLRELRFYPVREEMRQDWKFTGETKYNEETAEADYSPAPKEFSGDTYPLRYLNTTAVMSDGEAISGDLASMTLYLEPNAPSSADGGLLSQARVVKKLLLVSKQRGEKKSTLDELVYIERIRLLDEGADMAAAVTVVPGEGGLKATDNLQAVTCNSLTPVPTQWEQQKRAFVVRSAFGEKFYLAVKSGDDYQAGWPEKSDPELIKLADEHLQRQRDFYNEKTLLGAVTVADGREVLTLVNLRRRFAPTHFGDIGGEWDKKTGGIVEPWRLSIWRWKYNPANRELILVQRGTFFRRILNPADPTPRVTTHADLWNLQWDEKAAAVTVNWKR